MSKTARSTWKAFERRVAEFFHTRRAPLSGVNGGVTQSDTMHPRLYVECKLRQKSAIHALYAETADRAKLEQKTPILALGQKNRAGWLLVIHCGDLHQVASFARDIERLPGGDQ